MKEIIQWVKRGRYYVSFTHTEKLRRMEISLEEIEEAISDGEIIEDYSSDPRGASCLTLGFTHEGKALHMVCGKAGEGITIITAYEPGPDEWEQGLRTRRK